MEKTLGKHIGNGCHVFDDLICCPMLEGQKCPDELTALG
ncbi:hypothetical protein J2X69_000195 [Algoriphagus sp. 4150]|nr:hypothetical protein [Algoriphagus sp. 4150]